MVYDDLLVSRAGGVVTITINRPDRHNALRIDTYEELVHAVDAVASDPSVGVVVVTGAGERAFCSGGDVSMATTMLTSVHAARHHFLQRMLRLSTAISELPVPVIFKINGLCVGGGAELMLFADLVYAAEHAYFVFNGTNIGGCSWWGAPQLLPTMVGLRRAEEILYTSRKVSAAEAERIGLITQCVSADALDEFVAERCEALLDLSAEGLRLTKAAIRDAREQLLRGMVAAAEANAAAVAGPDVQQSFSAFLNGEPFSWRGLRPRPEGEHS